ncbi:MAG: hypothetical protein R6X02_00085 [Enhygromyxa sp.]
MAPQLLYDEVTAECDVMVRYALGCGRKVSPQLVELVAAALGEQGSKPPITELARAHRKLALIIAPAEPRPLRLLRDIAGHEPGQVWFRMPLPRNLTMVAILSIVTTLAIGTSPYVSASPDAGNPMLASGWSVLINQAFFLSIAALGSCFHGLFTVKRYIIAGTFDPVYSPTYWVRFLLGVMSGLILASLIEVDPENNLHAVARPMLALIGGFSASVVHRALERLVDTVDNLLAGDARRMTETEKRALVAEGEQRVRDSRLETAAALLKIQDQLRDDPEQARESLRRLMSSLAPDGEGIETGQGEAAVGRGPDSGDADEG